MRKMKNLFLVFIISVFALTLFACGKNLAKNNTEKMPDQSWHKEGYKQGDYGNVSKLDANGYAIEDNKIPNSRELPYVKYGWTDRDGTKRYKKVVTNAYVETNDYNPLNAIRYEIGDTGVPVIDIVTLFAANIVHDPVKNKPTIEFNAGIRAILENYEKIIKPLQEKGTRVVLDFLPHHQGWGYKNMKGENLKYFLDRLAEVLDKYNIDGIDMDDEYAEYDKFNRAPLDEENAPSEFVTEFRKRFPKKILSVFNYDINFDTNKIAPKDPITKKRNYMMDFAYDNYGVFSSHTPEWIHPQNHATRSIEANSGIHWQNTEDQAKDAIENGKGTFMYFNPQFKNDLTTGFSGLTKMLYQHETRDTGIYYAKLLEQ